MTTPRLFVRSLGVPIQVELGDLQPGIEDHLRTLWRRSLAEPGPGESHFTFHFPTGGADELVWGDRLTALITLLAIQARAGQLLMLHACGVAEPASGRVVAFIGPSGRGKTTAATALGRVWGYVSDETVGVEVDGRVHPHPKPLSVKQGEGPKHTVAPDALGLVEPPSELTLGRVVLLERDPDHVGSPAVEAVPVSEALAVLTEQMSHLRAWPEPLAATARLLSDTGGPLRVRYAEAEQLVALLPGLLDDERWEQPWWSEPGPTRAEPSDKPTIGRGRVREALGDATGVAVFIDDEDCSRVLLLDGIGPALWLATERPRTLPQLVDAVVEQCGAPEGGDAGELVRMAVERLVGEGVLVEIAATGTA